MDESSSPAEADVPVAAEAPTAGAEAEQTAGTEATAAQGSAVGDADAAAPAKSADAGAMAAPAAQSEPFEFGGRTWGSREEAEHSWKSWEGRIQAEQATSTELRKLVNEYWDYVQNVSKENEAYRAQIEKPAATEVEAAQSPAIDFDQIGRLMKLAQSNGLDPMTVGIKAYAQQAEKAYDAKLEARLATIERPIQDMENRQVETQAEQQMFLWAQGVKRNDGETAFPELQRESLDEAFAARLYGTWKRLGEEFGVKYAYSIPGFDYAYRLTRETMPQPAPAPTPGPGRTNSPAVRRDAQGRFTSLGDDARAASEITGTQPNPTKREARQTTQEALEELTAMKPVRIGETDLGFFS